MTDLIILSMLLPGPKHGYQLKHEAGMVFGQEALHNNLIYPLLRRFLKDGWVSKKEVPGERGQTRQQCQMAANDVPGKPNQAAAVATKLGGFSLPA